MIVRIIEGVGNNSASSTGAGCRRNTILAALQNKWTLKEPFRDETAATERRLRSQLLQDKLLDRVIEDPEAGADAGLAAGTGAPSDADARRKRFVIRRGETVLDPFISGNDQTRGEDRTGGAARIAVVTAVKADLCRVGKLAVKHRAVLSRAEGLNPLIAVSKRSVQLPAESIVQRKVGLDLPAVLREQIKRVTAIFRRLRR